MIKGVHTMFYSTDADATRAFLRDKLGFTFTDVGGGWLIFDLPEADMGCHPTEELGDEPASGTRAISFYCDDIHQTINELKAKGVEFIDDVLDQGFGWVTQFKMPGNFSVQLYQPKYKK